MAEITPSLRMDHIFIGIVLLEPVNFMQLKNHINCQPASSLGRFATLLTQGLSISIVVCQISRSPLYLSIVLPISNILFT